MVVTAVENLSRPARHYRIWFDTGQECTVHEDTMIRFRLLKGADIDARQYEQMLLHDQASQAYRAALRYLARRPHASGEVREKLLQRGMDEEAVRFALDELRKQGYIDDEQFADNWARERIEYGKKGRQWVRYEMKQKGLSEEQITRALGQVGDEAELQSAYELLCKKLRHPNGTDDPRAIKRKLGQYLQRKGFTRTIINRAFYKWNEENGDPLL